MRRRRAMETRWYCPECGQCFNDVYARGGWMYAHHKYSDNLRSVLCQGGPYDELKDRAP